MALVIGSGPAGVAAARALLDRGVPVEMVDGGLRLEPWREELVSGLGSRARRSWLPEEVEEVSRSRPPELGGLPLKLLYGSDFPYREVERWTPFENRGTATRQTLARGGFSTVWGAAMAPFLEEDLADWPISLDRLAPHYRAITDWVPVAASRDGLADYLPLYAEAPRPLIPSRQALGLLDDLERHARRLGEGGIRFGRSRLAVRAEEDERGPGCAYCGLCLSGCPYRLIYDASSTLADLLGRPGFDYRPGVLVERLVERGETVEAIGTEVGSGGPIRLRSERVFVGCGIVGTTRLMLASSDRFDRPVDIRDAGYFLLPILRLGRSKRIRSQELHTLSQVFLEIRDPRITERNIHLQIYGFNPLFAELVDSYLGLTRSLLRGPADALLGRLMLIQGYLHSDDSPGIRATLRDVGDRPSLVLEPIPNGRTSRILRRLSLLLLRNWRALGAVPLLPLLQRTPPGRGFHSGGSFPMRSSPAEGECDALGRPKGFSRVHLIDSSAFPTVPSTTITFTVMANAHRIASEVVP